MPELMEMERSDAYIPTVPKQVKLHRRHRLFVEAYLKSGNATKSAVSAGYRDGYLSGQYLLKVPKIRLAIESRLARGS